MSLDGQIVQLFASVVFLLLINRNRDAEEKERRTRTVCPVREIGSDVEKEVRGKKRRKRKQHCADF